MTTPRHPDSTLDQLVRQLVDREAIKELKARYFRLIDTKDWDAFADLFTEDCKHWLPEDSPTPFMTNEQYFLMLRETLGTGITVHHGHMPEITFVSATEAEGIWAMEDYLQVDGPAGRISIEGYGHYFETYRKGDDGGWRIGSKRNTRLYVRPAPWTVPDPAPDAGPESTDRTKPGESS